MKPRAWVQLSLPVPVERQDDLIGPLTLLGCNGFQQEENSLICFVEQRGWNASFQRGLRAVLARSHRHFPSIPTSFRYRRVAERNWNAAWEKSIDTIEVTERMVVKPSWRTLRRKDRGKMVLQIDPQMSFGTGHHESTRLCLSLLERHVRQSMTVLDVGTGTGILAIAAAKLGAASVVGLDMDHWALVNAKENVKKNRVDSTVRITDASLAQLAKDRFDLIVANIDLPTISKLLRPMLKRLRREGTLVLSGLTVSDLEPLLSLLQSAGVVPTEIVCENEWAALALTKLHAH
jgi:ribosomal protein L11 methyltransferase